MYCNNWEYNNSTVLFIMFQSNVSDLDTFVDSDFLLYRSHFQSWLLETAPVCYCFQRGCCRKMWEKTYNFKDSLYYCRSSFNCFQCLKVCELWTRWVKMKSCSSIKQMRVSKFTSTCFCRINVHKHLKFTSKVLAESSQYCFLVSVASHIDQLQL